MKIIPLFLAASVLMSLTPLSTKAQVSSTPAELRRLADNYYRWRNEHYPVFSSDSGLHTWDHKLTDYSLSAVLSRRLYVKNLLATVQAISFLRIILRVGISTFAQQSKIHAQSWDTRGFPVISCNSQSRITCQMRFTGNMVTASSSRAGHSTAKKC